MLLMYIKLRVKLYILFCVIYAARIGHKYKIVTRAAIGTEDEDGETAQSLAELWENATLIDLFKKDTLLS